MNDIVSIRRQLHQIPEIAYHEFETASVVESYLNRWQIPNRRLTETGVVGLISVPNATKTLLLRADMDAIPVTEANTFSYASRNAGMMHACGHDVHTAILLGTAKRLRENAKQLTRNVKFMFQPAEEASGGALQMIEAGVLENPRVDMALALHVWDGFPYNQVAVKEGKAMASPDVFKIHVTGKGGHGAMPQQCVNPVLMCCDVIDGVRNTLKRKDCLITFTAIECPSNTTVIVNNAVIKGTARALDEQTRQELYQLLKATVSSVEEKYQSPCVLDYTFLYPPLENNGEVIGQFKRVARNVLGADNVLVQDTAEMTGEDFSYIAQRVPAALIKLGGGLAPLHSERFDVDERCIQTGIDVLCAFALDE